MARQSSKLSARTVATLSKPGRHSDGGGLYLFIGPGDRRRWIFRFVRNGRAREIGLGGYPATSLAEARRKAAEPRKALMQGIDPLDAKKAAHGVFLARRTFGQCAAELHASKAAGWRNAKHASQWRQTLETHANALWAMPVDEVDTAACLSVLKPFWQTIPETASRVRGRIEAVLDYAKAHGLRSGENPAAWRGHLALILPKHGKLGRSHFAAMRYDDVPGFLAALHKHESVASMALELTILTAARVGEVLRARWDEIDFGSRVWTIPAARMKAGVAHRIPLSAPAVLILNRMASVRTNELVFAGQSRGLPVNAMSRVLAAAGASGVTVHGFRSSFRDWAGEETNFPREICEAALAHATGSAVEQAYRRGDALEKRRGLMAAWATFLGRADNVVNLASANAHV